MKSVNSHNFINVSTHAIMIHNEKIWEIVGKNEKTWDVMIGGDKEWDLMRINEI